MTDSVAPSVPRTADTRGRWWRAPLVSTLVSVLLLPVMRALRGFAEMATDPCYEPGSCPSTFAHLQVADVALVVAQVLILLQWPAAYLLRPARVLVSLAPAAAYLVVVGVVFSIPAGR
ncbi:hypothetical protein [Kitasatospora indigofera]|uniref:hypothetical protein n=1 Tax=Kitasatospora indigofera TaxID=67307 RepID=UPI0036C23C35